MAATKPQREVGAVSVSCSPGCAPYLGAELEALGLPLVASRETAVETRADWETATELCLRLRTAYHVLWRVAELKARDATALHRLVGTLPWERMLSNRERLTVTSATDTAAIQNTMFANRTVKDAVVDRLLERTGARPESGPEADGAVLSLFWKDERAWLYLSLSGTKLSDRGYRIRPGKAPMRESLAAAVLMASGWDPRTPLLVPMCGSGTLAIEAALMAAGRAPGLLRGDFGLRHLVRHDPAAWEALRARVRKEARRDGLPVPPPGHLSGRHVGVQRQPPLPRILASDLDPEMVEAARANAQTAGVERLIEFSVGDFAAIPVPETPGTALLHPEYGERLGDEAELAGTYKRMGDWMKRALPGWRGAVFTGNRELAAQIGLRPRKKVPFMNGDIDCRLLTYELYAGSRERPPASP